MWNSAFKVGKTLNCHVALFFSLSETSGLFKTPPPGPSSLDTSVSGENPITVCWNHRIHIWTALPFRVLPCVNPSQVWLQSIGERYQKVNGLHQNASANKTGDILNKPCIISIIALPSDSLSIFGNSCHVPALSFPLCSEQPYFRPSLDVFSSIFWKDI